jgi:hypothetical protein
MEKLTKLRLKPTFQRFRPAANILLIRLQTLLEAGHLIQCHMFVFAHARFSGKDFNG